MKKALFGALVAISVVFGMLATPAGATDGRHDRSERDRHSHEERHRGGERRSHDERRSHHERRGDDDRRGDRDGRRGDHRHHDKDRRDRDDRWNGGARELSAEDAAFVTAAAQVALTEINQARLAIDRSEDPVVQELGQQLIEDHFTQLVHQLPILRKYDVALPGLTADELTQLSELAAVPAEDFDVAFLTLQVANHEAAIELFSAAADDSENRHVRKLATKGLRMLHHHLDAATVALETLTVPTA